jgi:ribosomal protein S18 acetylase RimI-like enzyme
MADFTITLETSPDSADVEMLSKGLSEHSESKNFPYDHQPLAIFIRNQNSEIIGGLSGATAWGWLHISLFWLSEELRGKGYGKRLIGLAEAEALARGCKKAHLDTFSFQALGFYQKLGYEIFGELEDFPEKAKRFYLKKILAP